MKRKLTALFLTSTLVLSNIFAFNVLADSEIKVLLNENEMEFDCAPIVEDGRTLVPFRAILEEMGVTVSWDSDTRTITCTKEDKTVTLKIGEAEIDINGEKTPLDVPAKIIDGRTLVPLRAISESFNAGVDRDSDTRTVKISYTNTSDIKDAENTEIDPDANTNTDANVDVEKTQPENSDKKKDVFNLTDNGITLVEATVDSNSDLLKEKLSEKAYSLYESKVVSAKDYFNSELKYLGENGLTVDELKEEIKDILKERSSEEQFAYEFALTYDASEYNNFLSVIKTSLIYMGGAHPSTIKSVKTYNIETGEEVSLDDVSKAIFNKNGEDILSEAKALFIKMVTEEPNGFYDDAETLIDSLSSENCYLSNDGLVFFFNQYDIAPYAAGIIEAKIPFEDAK